MIDEKKYKVIFHIDMNCFYASCHIANDPSLKGKPIVVCHTSSSRKNIILSPSYEARKYGIKATMILREAFDLCPNVVVCEPDFHLYEEYSNKFFTHLYKVTEKIEKASIDEAYMDVTDVSCDNYYDLAVNLQQDILNKYNLPTSIGIAPNKFLAKMASDMKKPLGITILRKREIEKILWPLPIEDMFGVGKKLAPKLRGLGIKTIKDIAKPKNIVFLKKALGDSTVDSLMYYANGNDTSEVIYQNDDMQSSISNSYTFETDIFLLNQIKTSFRIITNTIVNKLNENGMQTQTIGIQIKYSNFKQINRSKSSTFPVDDEKTIWKIVNDLIDEYIEEGDAIRLVGVYFNRLSKKIENKKNLTLFDDLDKEEKKYEIDKLLKEINKEIGKNIINKGVNNENRSN